MLHFDRDNENMFSGLEAGRGTVRRERVGAAVPAGIGGRGVCISSPVERKMRQQAGFFCAQALASVR